MFTLSSIRSEHMIHLLYFQIQRNQKNSRSLNWFYMLVAVSKIIRVHSNYLVVLWHHLWQVNNFLNKFTRIQWKRFIKHHGNTRQNVILLTIYLRGASKYFCFFLEPFKASSYNVPLITVRTFLEANGWKQKREREGENTIIIDAK